MDEERAHGAEFGELLGVAKPAAGVNLGFRRGIGDGLVRDVFESGVAEQLRPLVGAQEVRGNFEFPGPLVAILIVLIEIDVDPRLAAIGKHAVDFADAARGIGPEYDDSTEIACVKKFGSQGISSTPPTTNTRFSVSAFAARAR